MLRWLCFLSIQRAVWESAGRPGRGCWEFQLYAMNNSWILKIVIKRGPIFVAFAALFPQSPCLKWLPTWKQVVFFRTCDGSFALWLSMWRWIFTLSLLLEWLFTRQQAGPLTCWEAVVTRRCHGDAFSRGFLRNIWCGWCKRFWQELIYYIALPSSPSHWILQAYVEYSIGEIKH